MGKLVELMKNPVALGDAGEDATAAISFALGDDELYDDLGDAGDKDPEADARPIIIKWLEGAKDRFEAPYDEFLNMAHEQITQGPKQGELPLGDDVEVEVDEADSIDMAKKMQLKLPDNFFRNIAMMDDPHAEIKRLLVDSGDQGEVVRNYFTSFAEEYNLDPKKDMEEIVDFIVQEFEDTTTEDSVSPETQVEEVDEVAESIAKLKAMAGVGSKAKSNHGIHEGEEGYQITPRSIVARQMRKLQDIENKK